MNSRGSVTLTSGTFNDGGYAFSTGAFYSNNDNTRAIQQGGKKWSLTCVTGNCFDVRGTNLTFNPASPITIKGTSGTIQFNGGGYNYSAGVGASGANVLITGNNTFGTFYGPGSGFSVQFTGGSINSFVQFLGRSGMTIESSNTTPATLVRLGGGPINVSQVTMQYITGSPIGSWTVVNGTDGGDNSNISFVPSAGPSNWFIDYTISGGSKSGATWDNAASSLANLVGDASVSGIPPPFQAGDNIYVKATLTPVRTGWDNSYLVGMNVYLNAVGSGTTLGNLQQSFYNSVNAGLLTWSQVGGSNVYSVTSTSLSALNNLTVGSQGVWVVNPANLQVTTMLTGNSPIDPTDKTAVGLNKWAWDNSSHTLYINLGGTNPQGLDIEVTTGGTVTEIWTNESVYGGIFRFGNKGHNNGGCHNWSMTKQEFSYNTGNGVGIVVLPDTSETNIFTDNIVHNNGGDGNRLRE